MLIKKLLFVFCCFTFKSLTEAENGKYKNLTVILDANDDAILLSQQFDVVTDYLNKRSNISWLQKNGHLFALHPAIGPVIAATSLTYAIIKDIIASGKQTVSDRLNESEEKLIEAFSRTSKEYIYDNVVALRMYEYDEKIAQPLEQLTANFKAYFTNRNEYYAQVLANGCLDHNNGLNAIINKLSKMFAFRFFEPILKENYYTDQIFDKLKLLFSFTMKDWEILFGICQSFIHGPANTEEELDNRAKEAQKYSDLINNHLKALNEDRKRKIWEVTETIIKKNIQYGINVHDIAKKIYTFMRNNYTSTNYAYAVFISTNEHFTIGHRYTNMNKQITNLCKEGEYLQKKYLVCRESNDREYLMKSCEFLNNLTVQGYGDKWCALHDSSAVCVNIDENALQKSAYETCKDLKMFYLRSYTIKLAKFEIGYIYNTNFFKLLKMELNDYTLICENCYGFTFVVYA